MGVVLKEVIVESTPYWNQAIAVKPLLLTVALRVAEVEVILVAVLVVTVGADWTELEEEDWADDDELVPQLPL